MLIQRSFEIDLQLGSHVSMGLNKSSFWPHLLIMYKSKFIWVQSHKVLCFMRPWYFLTVYHTLQSQPV